MRKFFVFAVSRFPAFALGASLFGSSFSAAQTPAQLQLLQSLPADQQQAILQQVVGGQGGTAGRLGNAAKPGTPKTLDSAPDADKSRLKPSDVLGELPVPVLQPGDTVILQVTVKDRLQPLELESAQSLARLLGERNPFKIDATGQLQLPGLPPIALAGLDDLQANQRLAVEPGLLGLGIQLTRMALAKSGLSALKPFGYDLFEADPDRFTPVTDAPVPADYVMGVDDEIRVQLYGNQNRNLPLTVGRDGTVSFPELGPIQVAGLSFNAAKAAIESRVAQQMIGVRANVTMGDLRTIRVFVLGEARRPGSFTISGLGTMTSALFAAGGIKPIGSLRDVQLKRRGVLVRNLDLYDLLIHGSTADDARLQAGDVIFIPPVGQTVTVDGEVKRPAVYELRGEKDAGDLVALAGGLTPEADATRASLTRIDEQRRRVVLDVDLARSRGRTQKLRNGDSLRIERLRPQIDSGVMLSGAVHRPGAVPWREGMKLTDAIGSIDELQPDADSHYVLIRREVGPERRIEVLSADLGAALAAPNAESNQKLMPRDRLLVFERAPSRAQLIKPWLDELRLQSGLARPTEIVRVGGRVKSPGDYPLEPGMRVADLLRAGGSLDSAAYGGKAELARYEVNDAGARQTEVLSVDLAAALRGDRAANLALKPFDVLLIKESTDWFDQRSVQLKGEVRFPGTYPIRRGETLHEVINRAGGLTTEAFARGSVFTRVELREREQKQLEQLADRMQADVASMTLGSMSLGTSSSQAGAAQAVQAGQTILSQLKTAKAVGRLVINLEGLMAAEPGSSADVQLRDGDVLIVPKLRQEVSILGEVQTTTSHLYARNLSVLDYIQKSGGMTRKADKAKIYVVRADGGVVANEGSWFRKSLSTRVQPGDSIIVPLDTERVPTLPLWQSATQILYNLTVALAAVKTF